MDEIDDINNVNENKVIDMFIISTRNMFHPNQFLRVLEDRMDFDSDFDYCFNYDGVKKINKSLYIYNSYFVPDTLIDFLEFKTRLLVFYKDNPSEFYDNIVYKKIEIPNFENQLSELTAEVKGKFKSISEIQVEYYYDRSTHHEHDSKYFFVVQKPFKFCLLSYLKPNIDQTIELNIDLFDSSENTKYPESLTVSPTEALTILKEYILEHVPIYEQKIP